MDSASKKTPLYTWHKEHGGNLIDFEGWALPVKYTSILEEHKQVRQSAGIFDVSHMGRFIVCGKNAQDFLQKVTTNNVKNLSPNKIQYSLLCNHKGMILDDILVYKVSDTEFMIVVNASNLEKDLSWLIENNQDAETSIVNLSDETSMVAIQGPAASLILQTGISEDLSTIPYFSFSESLLNGKKTIISRTGYTGEDGFEIIMHPDDCLAVWTYLIEIGIAHNLKPIGLGARDTLRLEMKYTLYGLDIDDTTTPLEANLGWAVSFNKGDFIGRKVLSEQHEKGIIRKLVGFEMIDKAIPRYGFPIYRDKKIIGEVASGTFSPSLQKGIGTAYLPIRYSHIGVPIQIDVRGNHKLAEVSRTPFYKGGSVHRKKKNKDRPD